MSNREKANKDLLLKIKKAYSIGRETYGSPSITKALNEQGIKCTKNRVARLMRDNGIYAKTKRKFKVTTNSKHNHPVSPNLLKQKFAVDAPNNVWVTDITYIKTLEGWLYLCVILDLFSRKVVGWSMSNRINKELATTALSKAIWHRKPPKGLIVHSDQGSQYASNKFRKILKTHKLVSSMSSKGNCYDNAVAESFFHSLKTEHVYWNIYKTRSEAKSSIFDYIEIFYNRIRRHSTVNYMSPVDFERRFSVA